MSTPESTTESAAETPSAATNGDGRDMVARADSILTPQTPQTSATATPWWKRLLGRS
jgi:hypothetical protein